ncbi:MAG: hypothetical protein D8M28_00665 [Proteobacteria bacterium]|nr:hypothetical protein [Pseudomonadota bacterium]
MNYEDRIVCFIDILGFKEHIELSNNDSSKIESIAKALQALRRVLDIDNSNIEERDGANITQFSDSIVISFKYDQKSGVYWTLLKLVWAQATLVNHGMLVRGAIVRGNFIHTDTLLFGPGIVNAYETEAKIAIYPRIIIDEAVMHVALNYAEHHPAQEANYIGKLVFKDIDGKYCVDYLGQGVQQEFDDPEFDYLPYLSKVKKIIISNGQHPDKKIAEKYAWLSSKYNEQIDTIGNWLNAQGINKKDLKV